ncbi:serine/threonine-protein kinase 17A-like [Palaemon carinicauda]|uniref:serine/threonine-protein kinase 17A-like n=1 Tax=Palaemon carinicauda TaxID=392227 RepID=UPI0035B6221D
MSSSPSNSSCSAMEPSGRQIGLDPGQWSADPKTGVVTLTESALTRLINTDPIEKWYILEAEPFARGQFAVVYHARHRISGDEYAAKFSSRWRMGEDCTADILHEVAVCAMIKATPRAVQLQDVFSTEKELVLVMEYSYPSSSSSGSYPSSSSSGSYLSPSSSGSFPSPSSSGSYPSPFSYFSSTSPSPYFFFLSSSPSSWCRSLTPCDD